MSFFNKIIDKAKHHGHESGGGVQDQTGYVTPRPSVEKKASMDTSSGKLTIATDTLVGLTDWRLDQKQLTEDQKG